jgi:hypothetical protein
MTREWIIELREEIRQMIQQAVDASPFGFIVAPERDERQDATDADESSERTN